jgi:tetratricopeptide (TPR) repeat protein
MLLEHPAEVVTREQLQKELWPANTFVDFEHSLNAAIKRLRGALNDSANAPRYVETLAGRGYRFMAPVSSDHQRRSPIPAARWKIGVAAVVVLLAAGAVAGGLLWRLQHGRRLTEKDTIVLADFTNTTGDPVFDDALNQGLRVQLGQSPFLDILSEEKVSEELRLMQRPAEGRLTVKVAREVCERESTKAVLAGSISKLGSHYVIGLNALNCRSGDSLASEQVEVDTRERVLKALSQSATEMREKLGESLSSIQRYATPLEEATTPSLEALQAYSLGVKAARTTGNPIPFFQRAVQLDSEFAMAYALLGSFGKAASAPQNFRKAYELREKVSDSERFYIDSHYYDRVLGNLEKAQQEYELWQRIYPKDDTTYTNLATIYSFFGKYEAALEQAREAVRLHPEDLGNKIVLGYSLTFLERRDEAEAMFRQVAGRDPNSVLFELYFLAFLKGDIGEMERLAKTAISDDDVLLAEQAGVETYHGRLRRARELVLKSVEYTMRNDASDTAATYLASLGIVEAYFAYPKQALAVSRAAMSLNPDLTTIVNSRLGSRVTNPMLPMALAGDTTEAEKLAAELNTRFPQSTVVQRFYLPTFRAAAALQRKNPEKALSLLQEFTAPAQGVADVHPIYLRGQAYLMLHNGGAAAVEFQKIIDHPGMAVLSPFVVLSVSALSRLGLARAYALQGETARARTAYQDLLTLWKDADPDIPILKQAKAEYAKLQ